MICFVKHNIRTEKKTTWGGHFLQCQNHRKTSVDEWGNTFFFQLRLQQKGGGNAGGRPGFKITFKKQIVLVLTEIRA